MIQLNHPAPADTIPLTQSLGNNLRLKLILILTWAVFLPTALWIFLMRNTLPTTAVWQLIAIFLIPLTLWISLIWRLLRPLNDLYEGIKVLTGGQMDHRFNIHSGDEIETISQSLNTVANNLSQATTQSTLAKENIISERNKLNTIIASITDGVIVLDLHRNVVLINKAAEKVSGYTPKELVGQLSDNFFSFKTKESKPMTVSDVYKQGLQPDGLRTGQEQPSPTPLSLTLVGKNNQEKQVEIIAAPIAEGIQANLGCVLILYDISQRKDLEQMQIDFVSMASHEIRTPLTSIVNYLQTVSDEATEKLDPELKGFLDRALLSAKQLSVLVTNLLNVSKVERGSLSVFLQPTDWQKKLIQIVEDNRTSAFQKGLSLTFKVPSAPLPQVMVDEIRISEVLNNLISNSINHNKPDGSIEVSAKIEGNEIITAVTDTGEGMPKEAIPHLFTKFFRVAGSLEQMKQGTGLGLYISKSIVELHHGRIWAESELGKGSTFYFSLPIADANHVNFTMADLLKKPTL